MILALMVRRSLRQHALSTGVTACSVALAGGLLIAVWVVKDRAQEAFTNVNAGFDAVLGARGSKLQLVLNTIFHLEDSPGNLAWSDYQDIARHPMVELALPMAVGDNYRGYRLVGITSNLFTRVEFAPGRRYTIRPPGRGFDETLREAVVGSVAAARLGLKRGDRFHPYHGLRFEEQARHQESYVVVGILEPSNTPADRVIWIPLAGIQNMGGHDPKTATDISGVLVKLRAGGAAAGKQLEVLYNKQGTRLTFAWPVAQVLAQLFDKIAWFERVLAWVAYLVAAVALGSIMVSIYNSINERRRDIAILRAIGARRRVIFGAVVVEATTTAALGMAAALGVYVLLASLAARAIQAQTGVVLDIVRFDPVMVWAPCLLILGSALGGIVPAIKAYRTPVAENLVPIT